MIYFSSSLVFGGSSAIDQPLKNSRIGYQSIGFGRTPVASSANPLHPATNANTVTTFEFWRPTAMPATWGVDAVTSVECDYVGIVGDIQGRSVSVEYSTDNVTWTEAIAFVPINRVAMGLFSSVSARYWRVLFDGSIPNVAVIYIGKSLAMQRSIYQGHTPITLSRTTQKINNVSDRGQYLGTSIIRTGVETSAEYRYLSASWYRANFDPFVRAARTRPFFFAWRPASFPNEVGYVWTNEDIAPENSGPRDFMSVSMSMTGIGVE